MAGDRAQRRKRVLILGAGPAQLGLLRAARARGLYVVAADRDPGAPGFEHADRRALVSAEDEPGVQRLAEAEDVDGVIAPGIDWPVGVAARVAERLGLPHPVTAAAAAVATSKVRQRRRFAEAGVPQPRFELCRTPEEAARAARALGFPCVVKAPDRQGQRGLALVRAPDEVGAAAASAIAASRGGACLVEERGPGREVTVNGFSVAGAFRALTVTDRELAPDAFGVALAHVWPSELAAGPAAAAAEAAGEAARAVGIETGPTYTQLLAGPEGPRVVELAARLGGGHDSELCRAAVGVDLNGLALAAALGEVVDGRALTPSPRVGGACVRFLVCPPGRLERVDGLDEARALDGVLAGDVYRAPGHLFGPLRRGADRAGYVLATGGSRAQAVARARAAAGAIRFGVVPE